MAHDARHDDVPAVFGMKHLKSLPMHEITVGELRDYMLKGDLTSVDYVNYCLERIHRVNPFLEAVIGVNPEAVAIAAELDEQRRKGSIKSYLHGIPVLVKDNISTRDEQQTTAGSWALLGAKVSRDAHVVSLLRKSGAVIIGHASMSEWASVRSTRYSTGFSARGGQVRNPFDLAKSPFGSSSGSAVAVSANLVPISYGTETDTSIIGPAGVSGIVGIKPTVGLTSRAGVIPISKNLDTVGPFGRTVADAVAGLNAIASPDVDDAATLHPARKEQPDYLTFLASRSALKGAKFGLPWTRCWDCVGVSQKGVAESLFEAIRMLGGKIVRSDFPCIEDRIAPDGSWNWKRGKPSQSEFTVVKVDAYNGINEHLSQTTNTTMKSVEDIVEYNNRNSGTEGPDPGDTPAFLSGQDILREVVQTAGREDATYTAALNHVQKQCRDNGIDAALRCDHHDSESSEFDALLLCDRKGAGQQIAAQAGYPIVTIPIGLDTNGFPVSLSLQHRAWQEGKLIKWASAIEDLVHHTQGWRPMPKYKNHMSKNIPIDPLP